MACIPKNAIGADTNCWAHILREADQIVFQENTIAAHHMLDRLHHIFEVGQNTAKMSIKKETYQLQLGLKGQVNQLIKRHARIPGLANL